MKYITTQAEIDAEQALHPDETKFKIFSVDNGTQNIIEMFWAVSKNAAYEHLIETRKKLNRKDIFFDRMYNCISKNDDGTISIYDSLFEMFKLKDTEDSTEDDGNGESPYEIAKREKDAMMKDIKFFIDHYDHENCSSHMRNESWSLDTHMLDDLEFNIPIIKEEANGVPQNFIDKACEMLHYSYEELVKNKESDDKMFNLAKKFWHEELDNMLHHIWLYDYYSDYGVIDNNASDEKKEFLKNYKIPMEDGRFDVVDYAKIGDMIEVEWKAIWEWMTKYGRSLWT